ncbi:MULTISPECIES: MarR family winged helix-turn-helix transcriptional regulator [unclassified Oceanispirochaeta]|uniref:MarR family winged helix-turn-helix transcriptional regulator n=1 Tax=unclassified Oceanispirochaeta TaxID=2635722 RepID=UPI000E09C267|nr:MULTISPECIES: MarR family transcriptional regulator [unclassified Oceanispirochaeta]MBF9015424.1 MarR family transcriptional regulator [Oceanispirochaeta sp. M2]NPD71883.1 MarR family transcriptional regulator [Oceanispirochaeta sp. M1]RDG32691.1 MarR family transcriptional regulator [Oceanispirochaeta sp. M1]
MKITEDYFSVLPRLIRMLMDGKTPQRNKNGINLTQEKTIMMVSDHEGNTLSSLSRYSELDKGALSRVLKTLEKQSLIRQERDTHDRRSFHILLTEEGQVLTDDIRRKMSGNISRMMAPLTTEQKEKMTRALVDLLEITEALESIHRT